MSLPNRALSIRKILGDTDLSDLEKQDAIRLLFAEEVPVVTDELHDEQCHVCYDEKGTKLECCSFQWCDQCMSMWIQQSQRNYRAVRCPQCRTPVIPGDIQQTLNNRETTQSTPERENFRFSPDFRRQIVEDASTPVQSFREYVRTNLLSDDITPHFMEIVIIVIINYIRILMIDPDTSYPRRPVRYALSYHHIKNIYHTITQFTCGLLFRYAIVSSTHRNFVFNNLRDQHPEKWSEFHRLCTEMHETTPSALIVPTVYSEGSNSCRMCGNRIGIAYVSVNSSSLPDTCHRCTPEHYALSKKYIKFSADISKWLHQTYPNVRRHISKCLKPIIARGLIRIVEDHELGEE